ncbi:hypothetical protein LSH36_27g03035 [Paralvinella palmiformis]|uniref:Uncharacterized protein n=1 Tax=Paralvinella palmiformis TaxID=53620 RepID=A0AAD9NEN1_9ANNE|nr:hypothetical protein LSH36_27g03035 [Paralvinella palmiformis]
MGSNSSYEQPPQSVHGHQPQQQQQQKPTNKQPQEKEEKTDIKMKKVKLDKQILEKYLDLEKQIRQLESKNVLKNYEMKQNQLRDFEDTVKVYEQRHQECIKRTAKEKADVDNMTKPSVKEIFSQQSEYDANFLKEQEEYLEALNKQEIAKKELDQAKVMKDQVKSDLNKLKKEADQLQKIYTQQDELLASIFSGKYGSELEFKLESGLDMLLDQKQRISIAKYKWQNSRLLINHAVQQMKYAIKKWSELMQLQNSNMQARYSLATEARNNLVAASQNITNAHKYLNNIEFPYCKPDEMETLNNATNNIYTDMQTAERQGHAMNCYTVTYKRASALLQWFDHVISNTIDKDLNEALKNVDTKTKELRKERLRLIKEKINEAKGKDENLDIDGEMDLENEGVEPELENLVANPDAVSTAGDLQDTSDKVSSPEPTGPTPLPVNQLAPVPKNEDLFGNIDELKKQHEQQLAEFEHAQEVNKARMNQGLEEKLRARRSQRARQQKQ